MDADSRFLAFSLGAVKDIEEDIHVILNMSEKEEMASLPRVPDRTWHVTVDTSQASPHDIHMPSDRRPVSGHRYLTNPRSVVVLEIQPA